MRWRIPAVIAAGLLGLLVAAALGYFALQLVSQPTGLSAVPQRANEELIGPRDRSTPLKTDQFGDDPKSDHDGRDSDDERSQDDRKHDDDDD